VPGNREKYFREVLAQEVTKMAMPEQSSYLAEGIVNSIGRLIRVSANKTIVADGDYAANDVLSVSKASGTAWEFKN